MLRRSPSCGTAFGVSYQSVMGIASYKFERVSVQCCYSLFQYLQPDKVFEILANSRRSSSIRWLNLYSKSCLHARPDNDSVRLSGQVRRGPVAQELLGRVFVPV